MEKVNFSIGDKVKVDRKKGAKSAGGIVGKGRVSGIVLANYNDPNSPVYIQVYINNGGAPYSYFQEELTLLKTQTLHAYTDATEEVHWATRVYSDKELKSFGLTKASQFDKTIDLE